VINSHHAHHGLHLIAGADGGQKFQILPQIDGAMSGQLLADDGYLQKFAVIQA
jgi:hypothetical protein